MCCAVIIRQYKYPYIFPEVYPEIFLHLSVTAVKIRCHTIADDSRRVAGCDEMSQIIFSL